MWNKLLGIVLIITIFPTNSQEVSTKLSELSIDEKSNNEPYSEKVVYPLPPGVQPSTTSSKEESFQIAKKTNLNLPLESVQGIVGFTNEFNTVNKLPSPSTTERILTTARTQKINHQKEATTTSSTDANLNKSSTKFPPTQITIALSIVPEPNAIKPKQCMTPIGKNGECIDIYECPSLLNLLSRQRLLEENKLYLKRSQCGLEKQKVLVCCPDNVPASTMSPKLSLLPKPNKCGFLQEDRIFPGINTQIDAYNWMALLEYAKGENDKGFRCGGALISDRYILTAAHCVSGLPKNWTIKSVRLGEWDLATDMDCSEHGRFLDCTEPPINISIEEVIPHKDYSPTSQNRVNDIALIRLATQVNSTEFIQPICLPYDKNINLNSFDEQILSMVGWGVKSAGLWNNVKQQTQARVLELNNCRSKYAKYKIALESTQFCVEGSVRNDTCRGDSGGPVISRDTTQPGLGRFYLAGVRSFGESPCYLEQLPVVYTSVAEYMDWILENIHA